MWTPERCLVNFMFAVIIFVLLQILYSVWKREVDDMAQKALDDFRAEQERERWLEGDHKNDDDNS